MALTSTRMDGYVTALRAAARDGDTARARAAWLTAQLRWERVGAAYGSFGDLADAIDGLPQGLSGGTSDSAFTGLHRIEYGLWQANRAPVCSASSTGSPLTWPGCAARWLK
jgi:high-affinity iron transporter